MPQADPIRLCQLASFAHKKDGRRIFYPDQFVDAGAGSFDSVLASLAELASSGYFQLLVVVRCVEGHKLWEGPADKYDPNSPPPVDACPKCEAPDSYEDSTAFKFVWTGKFDEGLQESADPKAQTARARQASRFRRSLRSLKRYRRP